MVAWSLAAFAGVAPQGKIFKVLPHHVDLEGRHTQAPSLFSRDTYQAYLRKHPELCSGLRFDVQWRCRNAPKDDLKLRVEIITTKAMESTLSVIEQPVTARTGWSRWTGVLYGGDSYRQSGKVVAWRTTLWAGGTQVGEQSSFLWKESEAASKVASAKPEQK